MSWQCLAALMGPRAWRNRQARKEDNLFKNYPYPKRRRTAKGCVAGRWPADSATPTGELADTLVDYTLTYPGTGDSAWVDHIFPPH